MTREYHGNQRTLFDDQLDEDGNSQFSFTLNSENSPSGFLRATFTSRVFENGGDFSINSQSVKFSPYDKYIGLKLPKGDAARGMLLTDQDHLAKVVVVDADGKPLKNEKVHFTFHKISWKWWWDKSGESLAKYASSSAYDMLSEGTASTDENGKANWAFQVKYPQWGRYLVRACSKNSDHCSSKVIYIDWPGWAGRAVESGNGGVARLSLVSDKKHYNVGDTAVISLPESINAKLLVSLENGSDVIKQFWAESKDKT